MQSDLPTLLARLRGLFEIAALPSAPGSRAAGLGEIARTIGEALAYETVAINLLRPAWGDFEVVAVHGDERAREALLGTTTSAAEWEPLLVERFHNRGAYLVQRGEFDWSQFGESSFVPEVTSSDDPTAWDAEDALFVPMRGSSGRLIGILSVDGPTSGRRPTSDELDALVAVAAYAARAVESAEMSAAEAAHRHGVELLLDVSARLSSADSVSEILESVCAAIRDALGFELVVIELADREQDRYVASAAVGVDPSHGSIQLDIPIAQLDRAFDPQFEVEGCFLLPRDAALARVGAEPSAYQSTFNGTSSQAWNRHWLLIPLVGGGEQVGFIWVDDPRNRLLPSKPTLQALKTFANQAGTAIVSARQRLALERRTAELEALHTTTVSLLEHAQVTDILEAVVARAAELVGTEDGFLYHVDTTRDRLVLDIALGTFAPYRGSELGRGEGLSGRVWDECKAVAVDDYSEWPGGAPTYVGVGFRAIAGVPLVVGGEVVGVIGVGHAVKGVSFGASELTLLTRFAHLASLVLERAQLLGRLQDERDYSDRLIDSANALVVGVGPDGRIELFNAEASRVTGYAPREMLGKSFVDLLPEGLYDDPGNRFARSLLDGSLPERYETPIVTRDGDRRLIDFRMRVVFVDGQPHGVIAFGTDVTDVRRLEEELRQSQKMEAVGRLAGGIAHDFNNLLTAINGYGELALTKLDGVPDVREHVFEMKRAGERAADLTRQLLAFSRRQVLQPETLDVNEVVSELERLLRRLLGAHVEFATDLDPQLGATKADPGQLEQVVMNLALNARDAMPEGGRVTVATRNEVFDGRPYVVLEVSDDGQGMDPETLEQAFEPFFTTKPPGEGTGLGLSTVYGIVKQSGGDVVATSAPGAGTTMRVLLPQVSERPRRDEEPAPPVGSLGGATVLLAEDEDVVRRLVGTILRDEGYRVLEATNGAEALAVAADAGRIDYLVTDVVMPGLGGADVAASLLESRPDLLVLFVSGYSADAISRTREATPGVGFLQKPFTRAELVRALADLTADRVAA